MEYQRWGQRDLQFPGVGIGRQKDAMAGVS